MKFEELDLSPNLLEGIKAKGFEDCTPIQAEVMPIALAGKDISGLAQTGTGKTAAFLIPMMERICRSLEPQENEEHKKRAFTDWKQGQFILILVPTRELAEQVQMDVESLKGTTGLRSVSIFGGTSYENQKAKLKEGVEFVIGTPGRLIDLYKTHFLDLRQVRGVVFDEADRMFDMGFKDDMQFLLQRIPKERQVLMFSATLNFDVTTTAYKFGAEPVELNVSKDEVKAENVEDKIIHAGSTEKAQFLYSLLKREDAKQIIVFSNFKSMVGRISKFLTNNGLPAVGISSLLTQKQRQRVMEQFKGESEHNILVATDVAARGLDIKGVDLVINFDLPDDAENYIHRIGRTGRAGKKGKAISLVGERDVEALMRVEEYLEKKLEAEWLEDADLIEDFKPFPREEERRSAYKKDKDSRSRSGGKPRSGGPHGRRDNGGRRKPDDRRSKGSGEKRDTRSKGERSDRGKQGDSTSENNVHRDRRTGRHKTRNTGSRKLQKSGERKQNENDQKQSVQANGAKPNKRKRTNNSRRRSGSGNRRRSGARTSSSQPAGLAQKVSGFFKKLFS